MKLALITYLVLFFSGAIPLSFYLKSFIKKLNAAKEADDSLPDVPIIMLVALAYVMIALLVFQFIYIRDCVKFTQSVFKKKIPILINKIFPFRIEFRLRIYSKKRISQEYEMNPG